MRISLGYPDRDASKLVLDTDGADASLARMRPVATVSDVRWLISAARNVHVADALKGFVLDLVESTREHASVRLGASPRGALSLMRAARARALLAGRSFVTPDDIQALAPSVLGHRLLLDVRASRQTDDLSIVQEILQSVPVPVRRAR